MTPTTIFLLGAIAGITLAGIGLLWVLSMCRSSSRADECAECLRRRREWEREEAAMKAASLVILDRPQTDQEKLDTDEFLAREFETSSNPKVIQPGKLTGAILH